MDAELVHSGDGPYGVRSVLGLGAECVEPYETACHGLLYAMCSL